MLKFCALLALVLVFGRVEGANWAVLVAGSSEYYNYRHQADICHAFHLMCDADKGNIPTENVIVMMYDDIAMNSENPVKGNIINHPNSSWNVYEGTNKDYTGASVTPQNFLAVIQGQKSKVSGGNGKVLNSTSNDNVFIYFADHGAPGLIAFPSDYLYANDLITALKYMNTNKMYNQLVFYIEACESGSMFDNILPNNMNIYATTAATPDQSSYACYWSNSRQTYLGDEYSVRWMEDSDVYDKVGKTSWTLLDQFNLVVNETLQSQPQQYGQLTMSKEPITNFQANTKKAAAMPTIRRVRNPQYTPCGEPVSSRDVKLKTLMKRRDSAKTKEDQAALQDQVNAELLNRARSDFYMDSIVGLVVGSKLKELTKSMRVQPKNFDCYKKAVVGIERACGRFNDYSMKHMYLVSNLCEQGASVEGITNAAFTACNTL